MISEDEDSIARIEFGDWRDELVRSALADSLGPPLPHDFAQHTAAFARRRHEQRLWGAAEIVMVTAFIAILGLFIAGLRGIGVDADISLLTSAVDTLRSISLEPWLAAGIGCFVLTQVLAFGLRARPSTRTLYRTNLLSEAPRTYGKRTPTVD